MAEEKGGSWIRKVPCEVYSRVVGYLRPIQNWNKGKQQEFKERKPYRIDEAALEQPETVQANDER